jgi:ferredoxin
MNIRIDPDQCQGHSRCYGLAPDLFTVDEYGLASVTSNEVPEELTGRARQAAANCPEFAIEVSGD